MSNPVTMNLATFDPEQLTNVRDIMTAWIEHGLPADFGKDGVTFALNTQSKRVFLTNDDFGVAVLEDAKLVSFYSTPYAGVEGTLKELEAMDKTNWKPEDIDYLQGLKTMLKDL